FLVLAIGRYHVGKRHMIAELAGGAFWQSRVEDVVLQWLVFFPPLRVGPGFWPQVDRNAISGWTDGVGEKCAVVASVVPRHAALIKAFLPESDSEFDRFDGCFAGQRDSLPVGLDLLAAP